MQLSMNKQRIEKLEGELIKSENKYKILNTEQSNEVAKKINNYKDKVI